VSVEETLRAFNLYDADISLHGFLPTMRDYRLVVYRLADQPLGLFNYDFRGCVEARYELTLPRGAFSMDDRLLDPDAASAPDAPLGFQWSAAGATSAEEGVTYSSTSDRARAWTDRLGIPMHEVIIGTNVYRLELVFHDLTVQRVSEIVQSRSRPDV
jgi:hypothetical protein